MNKIQKILWSIFSGMVCIVYRSDALTVSKRCPWTLKDSIELIKNGCGGIQVKDSTGSDIELGCLIPNVNFNGSGSLINTFLSKHSINSSSVFALSCTGTSGIGYYNFTTHEQNLYSCAENASCINIDTPGIIRTISTETGFSDCKEHYFYSCDPTDPSDSGCCTKCPAAIQGVSEEELFGIAQFKPLLFTNDPSSVSFIVLCSDTDIYGTNIGTDTLQIYEPKTCVRAEKQNANSCIITVASSDDHEYTEDEHSDHTGIYKYTANDVCRYEKQN